MPSCSDLGEVYERVCVSLAARGAQLGADIAADELLSYAWEVLKFNGDRVHAAGDRWGYLYRCVERWMMTQITASAFAMRPTRGRVLWDTVREHKAPARLGENIHWVGSALDVTPDDLVSAGEGDAVSGEIAAVRRALVSVVKSAAPTSMVGERVQDQFRDAVWYIASWAGRGHLSGLGRSLSSDQYLLARCGRTPAQIMALANLVLGPRRAGPGGSAIAELIRQPELPWPRWKTASMVRRIRASFTQPAHLDVPVEDDVKVETVEVPADGQRIDCIGGRQLSLFSLLAHEGEAA